MFDLGFLNQLCVQPYPQAQSSMIVSESKILWTEASLNITLTSNLGPITVSMYSQETQNYAEHTDLPCSSPGTSWGIAAHLSSNKGKWKWIRKSFPGESMASVEPWGSVPTMYPDSTIFETWRVLSEWEYIFWWMNTQININSETLKREVSSSRWIMPFK